MIHIMHLRSGSGKGVYGAESVILSICRNSDKEKFRYFIGCFRDPRIDKIALIEEAVKSNIATEIIEQSHRFDISAVGKLCTLLRKHDVDIIHCHDYKANIIALIASLFCKVKLVTTLHGWRKAGGRERLYELIDSYVIRRFNTIIAVSENIRNQILKKGFCPDRIKVIHNGVDNIYFDGRKGKKSELGIEDDTNIVGTVGRLSKEKGQDYLLEAASQIIAECPKTKILIVGDGPFKEELSGSVSALGLDKHVIFTGLVPQSEIKEIYSVIDVFVLPSLTEGICMALLEAMAMGIPVVATNVGGNPEATDNGKVGVLIPVANSAIIAKAVATLLNDKPKREFLSLEGKNFVKKEFSCKKMTEETEYLYKNMA